jgi:hypothetical protein
MRLVATDGTSLEPVRPQGPALRRVELGQVAAAEQAGAPAWDPHEVWLSRVKQPREMRGG